MKSLILLLTILLTLDVSMPTYGQIDSSCFAIRVLKNGKKIKEKEDMYSFSKNGFYITSNIFYNLEFIDTTKVFGRIIDITSDSLYITTSFSSSTAKLRNIKYDTLKFGIKQIKKLRLTTEGIYGYTRVIDLRDYSLQIVKFPCSKPSTIKFRNESESYIQTDTVIKKILITITKFKNKNGAEATAFCYPYLTNNGLEYIYESDSLICTLGSLQKGE